MGIGNSELGKLNSSEVKILRNSWEDIMKNVGENGSEIFGRFLNEYNYFSYFRKFSNMSRDQVTESKVFKDHSFLVMSTIHRLVFHSGTDEELIKELFKLGHLHSNRNLNSEHFMELKTTIMDVMEKKLRLPLATLKVWSKAFDISYFYIFQVLKEHCSSSSQSSAE